MVLSLKSYKLVLQLLRFGIIGSFATVVNFAVVIILVELANWLPLQANVVAFLCSVSISFLGHRLWTFAETRGSLRRQLPAFCITSTASLALSEGLYYLFLYQMGLHYIEALIFALGITAAVMFVVSRQFIFR